MAAPVVAAAAWLNKPAACIVPARPIDPKPIAVRRSMPRRETRGTKGVVMGASGGIHLNRHKVTRWRPTKHGHTASSGLDCHRPENPAPALFLHRSPAAHKAADTPDRPAGIWPPGPNRARLRPAD